MAAQREERRLAAILYADVVGYSRLMGADESGTLAQLKTHRKELIDPKIAEHAGRIVKTTGFWLSSEASSMPSGVPLKFSVRWQAATKTCHKTGALNTVSASTSAM